MSERHERRFLFSDLPHVMECYQTKTHPFPGTNYKEVMKQLKYYPCALELMQKSRIEPSSKQNPNRPAEILHRFMGSTPNQELFFVQIKEDKRTGQKWLISVFPL